MMKKCTLLLLIIIIGTSYSFSCSCEKISISKNFRYSDAVFIGEVIRVTELSTIDTVQGLYTGTDSAKFQTEIYHRFEFEFKVNLLFKGNIDNDKITLVTSGAGTECGPYFGEGMSYLIYSYVTDKKVQWGLDYQTVEPFYTANLCSRTKLTNQIGWWEMFVLNLKGKKNS